MNTSEFFRAALERGSGVLRLAPAWVPRPMLRPGGRLRLHPKDLYALGGHRGAICERRLACAIPTPSSPGAQDGDGLSFVELDGACVPLAEFTGSSWSVSARLTDSSVPGPLHLHATVEGQYFPVAYNQEWGPFPVSFFGLQAHSSREMIRRALSRWNEGDNGILAHSLGYALKPGTGWQLHPGVLHAPGTMVTYELHDGAEQTSAFASICAGDPLPWEALAAALPEQHRFDMDFILGRIEFEKNTDPFFGQFNHREPVRCGDSDVHLEKWVVYGSARFSARELAVAPGASAVLRDEAPYGALVVQGHGSINGLPCEAPAMVRHGQMTADEFFISAAAAREGVTISNASGVEPLVILKHFGPGHPGAEEFIECKSE